MVQEMMLGAAIGTVLALTGAGGGILAVPMLVMLLHLPMQQAAPLALMVVGLVSAVGAILGLRQGIVRYRAALLIGTVGTMAAPLGSLVAGLLAPRVLQAGFAVLMLWLAWRQWQASLQADGEMRYTRLPCLVQQGIGRLLWTSSCARALSLTGLVSGFFSGLVGVGGGFVIIPALARYSDLPWRQVQVTSLAVVALVSASSTAHAIWQGRIVWAVAVPFAGAALLAYLVWRKFAHALPRRQLQRLFAVLVLLVAVLMLLKAAGKLAA